MILMYFFISLLCLLKVIRKSPQIMYSDRNSPSSHSGNTAYPAVIYPILGIYKTAIAKTMSHIKHAPASFAFFLTN